MWPYKVWYHQVPCFMASDVSSFVQLPTRVDQEIRKSALSHFKNNYYLMLRVAMTSQNERWFHQSENHARHRRLLPNLLGTFTKLRKATISFVKSVCLSVLLCLRVCLSTWNDSGPTRRIFLKFDICVFLKKTLTEISFIKI